MPLSPKKNCEEYEDAWRRCVCKVYQKQSPKCQKNPKAKSCVNPYAVCSKSVKKQGSPQPCKKNYKGVDRSQFQNADLQSDYYYKGSESSPLGHGYCASFTKLGTIMPGKEKGSLWIVQKQGDARRWRRVE